MTHSSTSSRGLAYAWIAAACLLAAPAASAQTPPPPIVTDSPPAAPATPAEPSIRLRGLAYFDYAYTLASPAPEAEGANGFDYRRIYLTADYTLSEAFSGRVRLEARGSSTTAGGRPAPFVKDAFIRWEGPLAEGHSFTLGVQPPPLFRTSERVWGYRSLAQTLIDRTRANDSRDFGLRADGPLAPAAGLEYGLMVGNGEGLRPEDGNERGKHAYAQVRTARRNALQASLGVDYTEHEGDAEVRDESVKVSAFAGTITDAFRGGVEAFATHTKYEDELRPTETGFGVSAFGAVSLSDSDRYRVVGRYDFVQAEARRASADEHYFLLAFVYAPIPRVEVMPNVVVSNPDGADAEITARGTVHVRF